MAYVLPLLLDEQELETRCPVIYRSSYSVSFSGRHQEKKGKRISYFFFFIIFQIDTQCG